MALTQFSGLPLPNGWRSFVSRATSVAAPDGSTSAVDQPVFGPYRYIAGPPAAETVEKAFAGIGNLDLLDVGSDYTGSRLIAVFNNSTNARIEIYVGTPSAIGASTPYLISYPVNAGKGGNNDILQNFTDDDTDSAWLPVAGYCIPGVVFIVCRARDQSADMNGAGNFYPNAIGVLAIELKNLEATGTAGSKLGWGKRICQTDILPGQTANSAYVNLNQFVCQRPSLADSPTSPTSLFLTLVDYQGNPFKNGGVAFAVRCSRTTATGNDWSFGTAVEVSRFTAAVANTQHYHGWRMFDNGKALISQGDSRGLQGLYYLNCSDPATYSNGSTPITGAYRYNLASATRWSTPIVVNGLDSTTLRGAQPVGMCFAPSDNGILCGSDEAIESVFQASNPFGGEQPLTDRRTSPPQLATADEGSFFPYQKLHRNTFHFKSNTLAPSSSGVIVVPVVPSATDPLRNIRNFVLASPDGGENWAVVHHSPENENVSFNPAPIGGKIHCGSIGLNLQRGWRSIPAPTFRLVHPVRLRQSGTTNYLLASTTASPIDCTATKVSVSTLSGRGISDPRVSGDIWDVEAPGGAAMYFTTTVATAFPKANRYATFKFKIRLKKPIAAEMGTPDSIGLSWFMRIFCQNTSDSSNFHYSGLTQGVLHNQQDSWVSFTIPIDVHAFADPTNFKVAGDTTLKFGLTLNATGTDTDKTAFYFALDTFSPGHVHPHPATPQGTEGADVFEVTPTTAIQLIDSTQPTHNIPIAGFLPDDGWDDGHPCVFYGLATRVDDTHSTIVLPTGQTAGPATANFFQNGYFWAQNAATSAWLSPTAGTGALPFGFDVSASSYVAGTGVLTLTHNDISTISDPATFNMLLFTVSQRYRHIMSFKHTSSGKGFALVLDTQRASIALKYWNGAAYGTTEGTDLATIDLATTGDHFWPIAGAPLIFNVAFKSEATNGSADGEVTLSASIAGRIVQSSTMFNFTSGQAGFAIDKITNVEINGATAPDAGLDISAIGYNNVEGSTSFLNDLSFITDVSGGGNDYWLYWMRRRLALRRRKREQEAMSE